MFEAVTVIGPKNATVAPSFDGAGQSSCVIHYEHPNVVLAILKRDI